MSRNIINKKKFVWKDDDSFRLNYQMVFDEKRPEEEPPDINMILNRKRDEWKKELESERKEAFDQGHRKGYKEGLEDARAELDTRLSAFRQHFEAAQQAWEEHQELMKPGLLNLVFEICENILGIPVTNGSMRNKLEEEVSTLFQELDKSSRPVLWVSAEDFDLVESLQKEYADSSGVVIRVSKHCNPGEYQLETNREKVVRDFRQMLEDFKQSLILPK